MTELLTGYEGAEAIMDHILIYRKTLKEHDRRLNLVLEKLNRSGLKLSKEKCEFRDDKLELFGHVISSDGIRPSPAKVAAVKELPAPLNISELRRTMGMINYLGRFLPDLSTIMRPIMDLLKSDTAWYWSPDQDYAFTKVKEP